MKPTPFPWWILLTIGLFSLGACLMLYAVIQEAAVRPGMAVTALQGTPDLAKELRAAQLSKPQEVENLKGIASANLDNGKAAEAYGSGHLLDQQAETERQTREALKMGWRDVWLTENANTLCVGSLVLVGLGAALSFLMIWGTRPKRTFNG